LRLSPKCMLTALLHMERQERRTDESTSAAVEWERRVARKIQGYSGTQRRELYTTGCSEREEMRCAAVKWSFNFSYAADNPPL
jgi:hypothetical protein